MVHALMPQGYEWCIAGGWAVSPVLASDMDVWILRIPELEETTKQLQEHFERIANKFGLSFEPEDEENARLGDPEYGTTTRKVGYYYPADGKPIHFIATTATDAYQVVDNFDISTHMVAITSDGAERLGVAYAPVTKHPVVVRWTPTTFDRYIKICKRFGHKPTLKNGYIPEEA